MAFLFTGCTDDAVTQEEPTTAILDATNSAESVETSISLIMDARIGSAGSIDGYAASITSDITIVSNALGVMFSVDTENILPT